MKFDGRSKGDVRAISWPESRAFRERHAGHPSLVSDEWDEVSEHIGVFVRGTLAASFRIVHAPADRLPICEHLESAKIDRQDVQFGRFVAAPRLLLAAGHSNLFVLFLQYFGIPMQHARSRIYAPLLAGGAFSPRRLIGIGFADTGARYFDARYGAEIIVLMKERPGAADTLTYRIGAPCQQRANRPALAQASC